jgi:surfeit locus 1 family protein
MPESLRFRPSWWAVALAAAGCVAGVLLGNWQSGRAAEKRAAATAPPVTVQGEFDAAYGVLLDNRIHRSMPGYHVVQPLRLEDGRNVLVIRGWVPARRTRDQPPEYRTPAGRIQLSGTRLPRIPQSYEPNPAKPEGRVWQNVTLERFSAWSGLTLEPYVIEQHSALDDGLVRDWPRPEAGAEKNEMYALQWYSLAVLPIILLIALNVRIGKRSA